MRKVAIIEARMGSTRRPGKTLAEIAGKPMLELLIERLKAAKTLDGIVVATTVKEEDQAIEDLTKKLGVGCYRGSSEDVLGRVTNAVKEFDVDLIVEITGDCPLTDPDVVDKVVSLYMEGGHDYVTSGLKCRLPRGLVAQVFSREVLEEVHTLTGDDPVYREHVSLYIYEHPEKYKLKYLDVPENLSRPNLRLVVDNEEDLVLMREIFGKLYHEKSIFGIGDVIRLLDSRPELVEINAHIQGKKVR
jgi:spore coat polysaccharide biosynthesis protein SpsF